MSVRTGTTVQRGIPLTILLVVLTVGQLAGVVSLVISWYSRFTHNQDGTGLLLSGALMGIVGLVAFTGVWLWRRWGVYLLAVVVVVGVITDSLLGAAALPVVIRLVLLAALGYLIRVKWDGFR